METQQVDQLIGQMVGGYRVEQSLSRGRLSAVYLARHLVQNQPVAITTFIIPEQFSVRARNRFIARFTGEAAALSELNHPHLLPIYGYGEHLGYPYLITPYITEGSLAHVLKRQGRCTPAYTLELLEQVAAGLDYAHAQGVVHRALKPSNVIMRSEHKVRVAGFGLVRMLELRDVGRSEHPYAHLLSLGGTFLGAPEYLAPEAVKGQSADARADIYSLGIMLFELLSGKPPYSGPDSLATAMQHVQQPVPSLLSVCPDAPPILDQVIAQALAKDPTQRFQRAGDLAAAYAQVLRNARKSAVAPAVQAARTRNLQADPFSYYTDYDEAAEVGTGEQWQLKPPIVTGQVAAVKAATSGRLPVVAAPATVDPTQAWQYQQFIVTEDHPAMAKTPSSAPSPRRAEEIYAPSQPASPPAPPQPGPSAEASDLDSFAWWSGPPETAAHAEKPAPAGQNPLVLPSLQDAYTPQALQNAYMPRTPAVRRPGRKKRRHVVALLATGTFSVLAAGAFVFERHTLEQVLGNVIHPQNMGTAGMTAAQNNTTMQGNTGNPPNTQPGSQKGTVIGTTALATNTSKDFRNPADHKASLLIHLPNGKFVAYEHACTHEGVSVNYDPNTHMLVCPAHGSIFDPARNGSVVQGPAATPLPHVAIRVNADGTITTA